MFWIYAWLVFILMLCFAVIHFLIGIFLNGAKEKLREQKNELENRLASLIRNHKKVTDEADSEKTKVRKMLKEILESTPMVQLSSKINELMEIPARIKEVKRKGKILSILHVFLSLACVGMIALWVGMPAGPTYPEDAELPEQYPAGSTYSKKAGLPELYYTDIHKYGTGSLEDLKELLDHFCWTRSNEEEVFDCSEMAAYMEWYLENHGFDTVIATNYTEHHAWVVVKHLKSEDGDYRDYPVEASRNPPRVLLYEQFHLIQTGPHEYEYIPGSCEPPYNHPDQIFNNIYEAVTSEYPWEYDWWNA